MEKPKKGDYLISNQEAWEITEVQSGICLCIMRMSNNSNELKVGSRATFSLSHIKHKIVNGNFRHVPKEKANTIKVLYS